MTGAAGLAALAYLVAAHRSGRAWSPRRTVLWLGGLLAAVAATSGPLAEAGHLRFEAHVVAHLLVAMVAPLLLVRSAPVTLALRALPVAWGRRLSRVLRTRLVRLLGEPVVAAALDVGGLWVYYRTSLFAASRQSQTLHVLVHTHMFLAGLLLATSVVGVDPMPHRRSFGHRALVLVLASAAHEILAKTIYAAPPVGVTGGAARTGAVIMAYGGDAVEIATAVVLCAGEYATRRRLSYRARSR